MLTLAEKTASFIGCWGHQSSACDTHIHSSPITNIKKDLRKLLDIGTLVTHWLSKVGFGTNIDFDNPGNHSSASHLITGMEVLRTVINKTHKSLAIMLSSSNIYLCI